MTICIATSNYFPDTGGIATYSRRLATLMANAGHKAIVLTIAIEATINDEDGVETEENGIVIIKFRKSFHTHYNHYKKYFKQGSIDASYWIAMGFAMQEWLAANHCKYNIDIIEASAFGGIGSFLKENGFPPILLSGHGAFFQYKHFNNNKEDEQTRLVEKLERLAFKNADGIISHSPQSKKDIEQYTSAKVHIARIAFIPEYNSLIEDIPESNSTPKYGLVVGGLQLLKGPFILLDALRKLNIRNEECIIRWAGTDNYFQETGELMSKELGKNYPELWNKQIIWENNPNDKRLSELYKNASFIIIPTIWESFNVISIEASFFKKAIIITETTGSSFLYKDKENALIINPENSEALADAITQLQNSPELCKKIGQAAYNTISELLKEENIVEERIKIYKEALKDTKKEYAPLNPTYFRQYTSLSRLIYFSVRRVIKKILKP